MEDSELMEFRSLGGQRIAEVWEKDELILQAARSENGIPILRLWRSCRILSCVNLRRYDMGGVSV